MADSDCDWQLNKPQLECYWQMFERQLATDVTFLISDQSISDGKKISAHKFMLIARSPVFGRMFTGALAEKSDEIALTDCHNVDAFTEMLRYMYTDKMHLDEDKVMDVLYLARKYMLPKATETCLRYVKHYCSPRNALRFLEKAISNAEDEIQQVCMTVIQRQTSDVISSGHFEKISNETLSLILDRNTLNATEEQLFEACIKWAKHKRNLGRNEPCDAESLRDTLGQCLYKIQYQNMKVSSFTKLVVNQNILDAFSFYKCIGVKYENEGESTSAVKIPEGFESGRVQQQYCEFDLESWTDKPTVMFFSSDVSVDSIMINCTKTVKLAKISLIIQIDPEITMDAKRDICHIDDSPDTVVINDEPSCHRIQYSVTLGTDNDNMVTENEQSLIINLHDNVEPATKFSLKLKLRSTFKIKLNAVKKQQLLDEKTQVSFNVQWAENSLPLTAIGYVLCD